MTEQSHRPMTIGVIARRVLAAMLIALAYYAYSGDFLHELYGYGEFNWGALLEYKGNIVFLLSLVLVFTAPTYKSSPWELAALALMSGLLLLGKSYSEGREWYLIVKSTANMIASLFVCMGFMLLFHYLLCWGKRLLPRLRDDGKGRKAPRFWQIWLLIFICWLPYLIARYPAGIEPDAITQSVGFCTDTVVSQHHPYSTTVLMGSFVKASMALTGSGNAGIFAFVLLQALACSAALAYTVSVMRELDVPRRWRALAIAQYALLPVYSVLLTSAVKDALYSGAMVLFFALLARMIYTGNYSVSRIAGLAAAAFALTIFRKNGVYLVGLSLLFMLTALLIKRDRRILSLIIGLLLTLGAYKGYSLLVENVIGLPPGSAAEGLSVPFQQTALFVKEHGDEVTREEKEIIAAVLDYDNLAADYRPDISDPVKAKYHGDSESLKAYFGVWARQLIRHPTCYIRATLGIAYSYLYPGEQSFPFWHSVGEPGYFSRTYEQEWSTRITRDITFFQVSLPGVALLCSAGFHSWVLIYLLAKAIERRDRKLLLLVMLSMVNLGFCLAGPTYFNSGLRYAMPYIYVNPLLAGLLIRKDPEKIE